MELDDFKTILNQKLATDHLYRSERDIAELLTKKANSVLSKIRKSLRFEIISCIVILALFAYLGLNGKYQSMKIYFTSFTIIFIPFTLVFVYLLKKTSAINHSNLSVKANLQSIVSLLVEFMKRYFQFTMALIPICFIFSFYLGYTEKDPIPEIDGFIEKYKPTKWLVIVGAIIYMAALTWGIYYFTKWYLKKLYGKYVDELKTYIAELKDTE